MEEKEAEFFQNKGIRKGILLSRYADLLKNWMIDERESLQEEIPIRPVVNEENGIVVPNEEFILGEWERQSIPLQVSEEYQELFSEFRLYFENEMDEVGDNKLHQEVEILNKLGN